MSIKYKTGEHKNQVKLGDVQGTNKKIRVLNLYSGIGGNRKLWNDEEIDVTAVENNPEIAKAYQDFFPNDKVIIADAHLYLLEHYNEFDFIWSSPPCPTHSQMQLASVFGETGFNKDRHAVYPDMELYQEILLLKHFFKGIYVVENVVGYYEPLIEPQTSGRHYFWCNFRITDFATPHIKIQEYVPFYEKLHGFDLSPYTFSKEYPKKKVLRNCVYPPLGLHIWNMAFREKQTTLK